MLPKYDHTFDFSKQIISINYLSPKQKFCVKQNIENTYIPLVARDIGYTLSLIGKNHNKIDFLVDSGATCCIINQKDLNLFEHSIIKQKSYIVETFSKDTVDILGSFNLRIALESEKFFSQRFLVTKESNLQNIVGLDFIMNVQGSLIYIESKNTHVFSYNKPFNQNFECKLLSEIKIKPNSKQITTAFIKNDIITQSYDNVTVEIKSQLPILPCLSTINFVKNGMAKLNVCTVNPYET